MSVSQLRRHRFGGAFKRIIRNVHGGASNATPGERFRDKR